MEEDVFDVLDDALNCRAFIHSMFIVFHYLDVIFPFTCVARVVVSDSYSK